MELSNPWYALVTFSSILRPWTSRLWTSSVWTRLFQGTAGDGFFLRFGEICHRKIHDVLHMLTCFLLGFKGFH
jgi:hypothetical protein